MVFNLFVESFLENYNAIILYFFIIIYHSPVAFWNNRCEEYKIKYLINSKYETLK